MQSSSAHVSVGYFGHNKRPGASCMAAKLVCAHPCRWHSQPLRNTSEEVAGRRKRWRRVVSCGEDGLVPYSRPLYQLGRGTGSRG